MHKVEALVKCAALSHALAPSTYNAAGLAELTRDQIRELEVS